MADDFSKDNDLDITIGYNDVGEKAAIKGAENVGKAIEKVGKKAKKAGDTDLKTLEDGLIKVGTASDSVANKQKKVGDALSSSVEKLKAQNTALRDTVAQFSKVTSMSGHRSISAKMASSSGLTLDVKKFAAAPALQSGMDYRKHLKNINSVTTQLEKYTQKTITSVAAIEKKTQAEVKNIAKMKTTESQLAAVVALEKNLSATISETSNTLSNTSIVTANFSKNLDGLVKVTKDDSEAIKKLKNNTVTSYNAFEASNRVLQEHKTILSTLKEKTAAYRKELQEKQKLEKEIANLTDEQRKIALLDQQNQRLAVAKAEFVAMSAAAEKYKNTLQAATRVGAKGYVPMPTNVPYTPTGGELTDKLNTMGSNYSELKRVTDARKESTDTIIAEAQALSQAASVADTYEDRLNLTKAATDKFKEALKENKDAMQTLNVLSANTGSNFKTYSKYVNENDAATLSLKNKVTDLANSYYDSQVGLKTQNTEIAKTISMLGAEEAQLKQVIKANNEANKARMKAQASQTAMTQLQGVPAGIASVSSNLVARQGVNTSAMASAKEFLAAADATNVYEDKLRNLDSAYSVINNAMKENKLAMASAKLTMEPLLAAYAEFKGDLDETDPKAKALKDTIEAMKKAYGDNMRAMREQGIEFESTRNSIVAEKKEWESLEKTARQASDKMQKKLEENARKVKANQDRVKGAMTDVASLARTVGTSLSRYVTAPLVAAGFQAVKFAAQMEMNIKSISILLGKNEEAAEELYTQVTRYAASTPYEIPDLTAATKQLLAYGSASKDVMKELQMLGDLAQNDAKKLESVTSAFGKVQARGVAHMRELNRFIMAGVPIIETLGKVINKVPEDLFKAVEQGQVSFDAVKQAVEMLTSEGGRFHNMSEELASTVKGRWATLSDEINLALKAFADDYMPIILKAIESVIDFARALQTMSASQRNMIKNWAFAAAAIGPILLMLSKMIITIRAIYSFINKSIATQKILNMLTVKYNITLQAASMTLTKGVVATVLLLITLIGGALLSKVKRVTEEFQKQKDAAVAIMEEISAKTRGEGYEDYVRAKAKEYITTNSSEIPEDFIFKTLLNETKESAPIVLANMETFMREYNQKMRELVAARTIWEIALTTPRMRSSMGAGDPSSKIEEINNEIKTLEATLEPKLKEASAAPTYMDTLKRRLGIGEASVQDITSLLNVFKYNTEAAINGTVEQFALFSSVIPVSGQAVEAMNNIIAAYEEGGEAMRSLSEDQFKRVVGAAGVQEGTTTYNLLKYLEAPTEEDVRTALDGFREFIDTVIKFKEDAVEDYIKATEVTFRKENLADIFFAGENWDKVDPALISKRADSIASAYSNIMSAALDEIMRDEFTLSIDQAFKKLKDDNEELFAKWEQSLKTARVTKKYDEFTKIQSDYGNKLSQIGKTEIQQFEQQLQDLKKELDGSDYEITSEAIDKLVESFSQLKFKEVEADLIAQKNALLLTSDALEELTYRQNNFTGAQIKGLRELKSYTNTIKELQEISGKDTGNIPLLADLSKVAEAMNKHSTNPWTTLLAPGKEPGSTKYLLETTKYRGLTRADYLALGDEISKAFESISKEIFEADEATKRLIYSSNEYAVFMSALTADKNFSELFSDVSITTMVEAAKSQLASLTVEIENFGKSTEEIMLATWEKILGDPEALKLFDDSELELINELIKKYKELIELQEDVNDNWNDMIKEIGSVSDVFRRNSRQDMKDKIQQAGDEANIEQSEIDANKALYDKVENAKILKGVLDGIANTGFESLISQLEEVGYAMAEGATWGEAFAGTMQSVVGAIINALPQLLMNAGLQLITAGQWHIGLPLLAASGVAALGKGYVNGRVNGSKDGTATPSNLNYSAKGDSFDRGRILNMPTVFNTASGLNVGGELGTEAILPLARDSNGRLGVNVAGSGNGDTIVVPVTVNIVNQSGVETEAEVSETTNADGGKNIEVVIKRIVNNGMANGEYDRTMKSRYGLSNRGVS